MTCKSTLLSLALAIATGGREADAQSGTVSSGAQRKVSSKVNLRSDPKCVFLREEYRRIKQQVQDLVTTSRLADSVTIAQLQPLTATVDELAEFVATSEELAAKLTILGMKSTSCERGEALSAQGALPVISILREKHVSRATARWHTLGGGDEDAQMKIIIDRINAIYDSEAKSFFNSDSIRNDLDPDIVKDYPQLLPLIRESALPAEQKVFMEQNSRYIKYDEAGRLYNILTGIDRNRTLAYAYTVRKSLTERAQQAMLGAQVDAERVAKQAARERADIMTWVWIGLAAVIVALAGVVIFLNGERYAKYKAIRAGKLRRRYWFNTKELILWEPGEAVVLLKDKKLVAMVDATGGYTSISAWVGQEYKGRITYKTQMMQYTSDAIHTTDGVPVSLELGILWQIQNPNTYVSRIAADYHLDGTHEGQPRGYTDDPRGEKYYDRKLMDAAQEWIRLLAGSTLREYVCELPVSKLISPAVQSYIDHYFQPSTVDSIQDVSPGQRSDVRMPTKLEGARLALNKKTMDYGIAIESLEVKKLNLPQNLEEKMAAVRVSFFERTQAVAETEARTIGGRGLNDIQLDAVRGLADIIGKDNVAKIEFMKAIGLAKIPFTAPHAPPFAVLQSIFSTSQTGLDPSFPAVPGQPDQPGRMVFDASDEEEAAKNKTQESSTRTDGVGDR